MKKIMNCLRGLWTEVVVCSLSVGTFGIILLLIGVWLVGASDNLVLQPDLVLEALQVHRLLTYCICHEDASSLLINLLLLLLLGQGLERRLGTLPFLLISLICAVGSALLYILFTKLLGLTSGAVCGYTAVQFATLTILCHRNRGKRLPIIGQVPVVALPWSLLVLVCLFLQGSHVLAHICGILVGLLYSTRVLSCLELSEQQLDKLESLAFCKLASRNSLVFFIRSPRRGSLPLTNPTDRSLVSPEPFQPPGHSPSPAESMPGSWMEAAAPTDPHYQGYPQGVGIQNWSVSREQRFASPWPPYDCLHNESNHHSQSFGHLSEPTAEGYFGSLEDALATSQAFYAEEELLRAGIMASLQDSGLEPDARVEVLKSSVSSLRLQQLERMGFATEKAVVALAATGKVEGAVSLLIEDQIGHEAVVKMK